MQNDLASDTRATPLAPRGLKAAGGIALLIAAAVVVSGIVIRSGDAGAAQEWSDTRSIPVVHLVSVKSSNAADGLTLPGTLAAWNAAKLYSRVSGYVRGWDRDIGAVVGAGTPLATIDTPELDQQIGQARADLNSALAAAGLARSTAARWNDLLTTHSVSQQEADEKNGERAVKAAAVSAARANLGRLLAMKGFATIRAPFAGVVTARSSDIGDLVGPGSSAQPLFAVADVHRIRVYVSVPQTWSASIHPGMTATLTLPDYPGHTFPAQVLAQSGAINPQSGAFQVQLVTDNPGRLLRPGGYAQVHFDLPGQSSAIQVPASALVFRAKGTQIALVDKQGRIRLQRITVSRDLGPTVEVADGLKPGDRIVDNPPDSVTDGELVRVQQGNHA